MFGAAPRDQPTSRLGERDAGYRRAASPGWTASGLRRFPSVTSASVSRVERGKPVSSANVLRLLPANSYSPRTSCFNTCHDSTSMMVIAGERAAKETNLKSGSPAVEANSTIYSLLGELTEDIAAELR